MLVSPCFPRTISLSSRYVDPFPPAVEVEADGDTARSTIISDGIVIGVDPTYDLVTFDVEKYRDAPARQTLWQPEDTRDSERCFVIPSEATRCIIFDRLLA
jgi:hypothetical protein